MTNDQLDRLEAEADAAWRVSEGARHSLPSRLLLDLIEDARRGRMARVPLIDATDEAAIDAAVDDQMRRLGFGRKAFR